MASRSSLAAAVVMALIAFAHPAARAACSIRYQQLAVTMEDRQARIETQIDGHPVKFIVDSGDQISTITPGTAAALHLSQTPVRPGFYMTGIGGDVTPTVTKVQDFEIAGSTLHDVYFLVGGSEMGGDTAGLLGQNVLHIGDVEYDLAKGVIRIVKASGCGRANMTYWDPKGPTGLMEISALAPGSPMTTGYAEIDGKRISVMFDTGANQSFVTIAAARRAGFDPKGPGVIPGGASRGVGRRMVQTWIMPVSSFDVGGEKIENTKLRVGDTTLPFGVEMLLGADFFLSHHIYVANATHRIFFTYNGGPVFDLRTRLQSDSAPPEPAAATTVADEPPEAGPSLAPTLVGPAAEALLATEPTDADGYARRGAARLGRGDLAGALADLTKAHEMVPDNAGYLYQRALAYRQNRQPFLAMADFDAALKLAPDNVEALIARAQMRLAGRETALAMDDLNAADRLLPKPADTRLDLAALYQRADALGPAAAQYDLWIKAHPDDSRLAGALNERCWVGALGGEDLDRALAACDSALRRQPRNPHFLDARGLVRLRLGQTDKALADYDAALALDPKIAWALYGRGLAEQRQGKADAAKADFAAAAAIRPKIAEDAQKRGLAS
jgi:tetratricopeptide (TPR) repeat protein/predicted aspartyl protease